MVAMLGIVCLLSASRGTLSLKPKASIFADVIKRFHGKPIAIKGARGEDPGDLKLNRDYYVDFVFSARARDVKAAVLAKLHTGRWKIVELIPGTMSFRRNGGREFGFFDYDRRFFPSQARNVTCVLRLLKPEKQELLLRRKRRP
jgi:hypothetical protein